MYFYCYELFDDRYISDNRYFQWSIFPIIDILWKISFSHGIKNLLSRMDLKLNYPLFSWILLSSCYVSFRNLFVKFLSQPLQACCYPTCNNSRCHALIRTNGWYSVVVCELFINIPPVVTGIIWWTFPGTWFTYYSFYFAW